MAGAAGTNAMAYDNRSGREIEKFKRIDDRRRAEKISIEALCGRAGVSPRTWFRIVAGAIPRRLTLAKLASALKAIERDTIDLGEV